MPSAITKPIKYITNASYTSTTAVPGTATKKYRLHNSSTLKKLIVTSLGLVSNKTKNH